MSFTPLQIDNQAQPYAAIRVQLEPENLVSKVPCLLTEVHDWLTARRIPVAGPALIRYCSIGKLSNEMTVEVGFPVGSLITPCSGPVNFGELPAGAYVLVIHRGPYTTLSKTTAMLLEWGATHHIDWDLKETTDATEWRGRVEHYLIGPQAEADPSHWHTEIAILKRES